MNDEIKLKIVKDELEKNKLKTILILGISSFIGSSLAEFLRKDYKVVGTYFTKKMKIPGVLSLPCNILKKDELELIYFTTKPDIVIYAVGFTGINNCKESPDVAEALNTSGVFTVTELSQQHKALTIYLSSGYVFSGFNKTYKEVDIPDAANVYGKNQASTEFFLQKTSLNYLIFRLSNIYGRGISKVRLSSFDKMQMHFKQKKKIPADNQVHTGFLDVYFLAVVIKICIENSISNRLFQLSSKDTMTNYDFIKTYAEVFNENIDLVYSSKWPFPLLEANPNDTNKLYFNLDVANIENNINIELPTVRESLEFTYQRMFGHLKVKGKGSESGNGINYI